jgi:hypothetical protein
VRGTIIRPTSRRFLSSWEIIIRPKRKRRKFDSRKSSNQFRATQSNPNKDAGRIENTPLTKWEPISYDGLQSDPLALRISTNPPALCLQRSLQDSKSPKVMAYYLNKNQFKKNADSRSDREDRHSRSNKKNADSRSNKKNTNFRLTISNSIHRQLRI